MSIPRIVLGAALVTALSMPLVAQQQKTTGYYEVACVKVNPGEGVAMREFIAGTTHKLAQELVDSGRLHGVVILRTVIPQGAEAKCDYAVIDFFNGLPPEPLSPENRSKVLHNAGIQMTLPEFYSQRDKLGTLVNLTISLNQAMVGEAKKGDYIVVNQMGASDIGACLAYEEKEWQPLAEEMVKAGGSDGWAANVQIFPRGAKDHGGVSSVDFYPNLDSVFKQHDSIESAWKVVHPDVDMNSTFDQFDKLCPIEHTVMYKVVDMVTAKK